MNKPDGLKRLLLAAVPGLAADPSRLAMFIDKGRIAARPGGLSFEYHCQLNIVVQDYAGGDDALFVPILAWIAEQQPDLLQRADGEPFTFESEILDGDARDVSIYLQLSEAVRVTPKEGGGFNSEPIPEYRDSDSFPGICCVPLRQIYLEDDLAAPITPGAATGELASVTGA